MAGSKDSKADKVFDVTKPGKTAASASSRPLIVGHKSMLKDPMVNQASVSEMDEDKTVKIDKPVEEDTPSGSPILATVKEEAPTEEEKITVPSASKIKIEPLSGTEKDDKPVDDEKVVVKITSSADVKKPAKPSAKIDPVEDEATIAQEKEPATEEESSQDEETEGKISPTPEAEPGETSVDDSQSRQDDKSDETTATTEQKKVDKEAQETVARNQQLEKLIVDKQYFVPIGEKTRKKRSLRRILTGLFLILLLGGALAYLMADVGIIKTSYKLPYHFFKQNEVANNTVATDSNTTTPTVSQNIYKSSGGITFDYPKGWDKYNQNTGKILEYVAYMPAGQLNSDPKVQVTVDFSRYTPDDVKNKVETPDFKLAKVNYTSLESTGGKTLYLREAFYGPDSLLNRYAVYLNITDKKDAEAIGSKPGLTNAFLSSTDGKSVIRFQVIPSGYDDTTLESTINYTKTDKNYLAAKAALSSIKFIK